MGHERSAWEIADGVRYWTTKLHDERKLKARYSVHDLRHAFAVRHYTEGRDIYATSRALHHSSVATTERQLRSIGLETLK